MKMCLQARSPSCSSQPEKFRASHQLVLHVYPTRSIRIDFSCQVPPSFCSFEGSILLRVMMLLWAGMSWGWVGVRFQVCAFCRRGRCLRLVCKVELLKGCLWGWHVIYSAQVEAGDWNLVPAWTFWAPKQVPWARAWVLSAISLQ